MENLATRQRRQHIFTSEVGPSASETIFTCRGLSLSTSAVNCSRPIHKTGTDKTRYERVTYCLNALADRRPAGRIDRNRRWSSERTRILAIVIWSAAMSPGHIRMVH